MDVFTIIVVIILCFVFFCIYKANKKQEPTIDPKLEFLVKCFKNNKQQNINCSKIAFKIDYYDKNVKASVKKYSDQNALDFTVSLIFEGNHHIEYVRKAINDIKYYYITQTIAEDDSDL